jgi:hypothetical protein
MVITAKFQGRCRNCGGRIAQGDQINWNRDAGASHVSCDESGGHCCIGCGIDAGKMMMNASLGLSCPDCYDELSG